MSFNRPIYDSCAYNKRLDESSNVLTYRLDPNKFYNCNPCRIGFGVVGGNNVSLNDTNLVDLESDLRNQTRLYSRCPERKYLPKCSPNPRSKSGLPCPPQRSNMKDLRECNLIHYRPRINHVGFELSYPSCTPNGARRQQGACRKSVRVSKGPAPGTGFYRF